MNPVTANLEYLEAAQAFHLKGVDSSYVLAVAPDGDLHHLYWGARLAPEDLADLFKRWAGVKSAALRHTQRREYASFGHNDLRLPALHLEHADGSRLSAFAYQSHEIRPGKENPSGLPGASGGAGDCATLKLVLTDALTGQKLELFYTFYPELDLLLRRASLTQGQTAVSVKRLMSASLDLPPADWNVLSLAGDWARERQQLSFACPQGCLRLESRRGQSSHEMSPFVFLSPSPRFEERSGEVFAVTQFYSGNWLAELEGQPSGALRLNLGLNDFDFSWHLGPDERLDSPEAVLIRSGKGLGALSRKLHRFVKDFVLPRKWRHALRPIVLNSWEACYFNFKHEDILHLAREARELGAEMLVLDDGWFGHRDSDNSSLGDWFDDKKKLPRGVQGLAEDVKALGLQFGLWFEPEMVSPDSDLYTKHPEWALAVPGRAPSTSRNQYVLDMGRTDVRDYLFERLSHYVESCRLDYIKWDMNRPLWETGNSSLEPRYQAGLSHRFMLGVYDLMRRLNDRFPNLLVEGCSGGGGRFDYGVLAFHPQIWTSDNTDPLHRLRIQHSSSMIFPAMAMTAHVSVSPNHLTGRATPLSFRAHVAMAANFGLEFDLRTLEAEEKKKLKGYVEQYKVIRPLVAAADFYRLESPFHGERTAWSHVLPDQSQALLFVFRPRAQMRGVADTPVKMAGLDPDRTYRERSTGLALSGRELMETGLQPGLENLDWQSVLLHFDGEASRS